jgi:hypothetical protein
LLRCVAAAAAAAAAAAQLEAELAVLRAKAEEEGLDEEEEEQDLRLVSLPRPCRLLLTAFSNTSVAACTIAAGAAWCYLTNMSC